MKYAICNETFLDWPLEDALAFAKSCGYEGIEFAPFTLGDTPDCSDVRQISKQKRSDVRQLVARYQLQSIGLHWLLAKTTGFYLTSPDAGVRRATAEYLGQLAHLCRDLDGHLMVLGSPQQRNLLPGVSPEDAMSYAADVLQMALPTLESQQVTLALEPLGPAEGNFLLTATSAIDLAQRIQSPWVRLHLDVKAMSSESTPIPEIIRQSAPHVAHFHANDPNRRGPGMGEMDFVPILRTLREICYDGWVSVEVFDYEPGPKRLAQESIEYLKRCETQI